MKTNLVCAALALAILAMTGTATIAEQTNGWYGAVDLGIAVAGANVTVKNRSGDVVARAQTDAKGQIRTSSLPPGDYEMVIDGPSLAAAIEKFAPREKNSNGSSVGLGVGGISGGGSSYSSSSHEGMGPGGDGRNSRGSSHSSNGLGISVPSGGGGSPQERRKSGGIETVVVTAQFDLAGTWSVSKGTSEKPKSDRSKPGIYNKDLGSNRFSAKAPYRRDVAGEVLRIGFKIPEGGAQAFITISLEPANSTLNE